MSQNTKFENPFGNIFLTAHAQGVDTVVSPTLPVDPNLVGPIFEGDAIQTEASIRLTTDSAGQIHIDDLVDIDIEISSQDREIGSFIATIQYDPTILYLIDDEYLDTEFLIDNGITNEQETGIVTIFGSIGEGATTVNRVVANLRFQAIELGSTSVSLIAEGSSLADNEGENILSGNSIISLEVLSIEAVITPVPEIITPAISEIPKSGITDPGDFTGILLGVIVLIAGVWSAKIVHENKSKNTWN